MIESRKRSYALVALMVLATLAACDGVYLMLVHVDYTIGINTVAGACYELAEKGCSVTAGRFGSVMGIPVAGIGFGGAIATLACGIMAFRSRQRHADPFRQLLLALTGFSVLASVTMATLSGVEGSFCPFCIIWYGLNAGLFAAAWIARDRDLGPTDILDDVTSNAAFVALGAFAIALIGGVLWHHARLARLAGEQEDMVEKNAPQIAERILEKNGTFSKPPMQELRMLENPTKLIGGATASEADVVIVEFGDFQCPHCKKLWESMEEYLATTDLSVRVHFAHYPLNAACNPGVNDLHPNACQAAIASVCAAQQDEFWAYGDRVFANQTDLDRDDLTSYAREEGLDLDAFATCMDDPKTIAQVRYDIALGGKVDLPATPTFVVNGYVVTGAFPPPVLSEIIKQILAHDLARDVGEAAPEAP